MSSLILCAGIIVFVTIAGKIDCIQTVRSRGNTVKPINDIFNFRE